ncbi:MAG: nuclear transport factor 2 family protein [candidate division NC10 bacterium]
MGVTRGAVVGMVTFLSFFSQLDPGLAEDLSTPEATIRALVQANADKDLHTMAALMAHDPDSVGYTFGGRKYVGWDAVERDLEKEFATVTRLEIPIVELTVWTRGPIAWFAMEIDYIRYVGTGKDQQRTVIPLRDTGVLERRDGTWVLVAWHESSRQGALGIAVASPDTATPRQPPETGTPAREVPDLSGEWLIEEEDKSYRAFLDRNGNGSYTHKGGTFRTISCIDRRLIGTWHQTGNDREGGFEVLLSEDATHAKGIWWYTRVGTRNNIPPRQHGGTYLWKRASPTIQGTQAQNSAD